MKPNFILFLILVACSGGCATHTPSSPVVIGKDYSISIPAESHVEATYTPKTFPLNVRILSASDSWTKVQLLTGARGGGYEPAGNAPFWLNLTHAITIYDLPSTP